jgi:hypothetical protein
MPVDIKQEGHTATFKNPASKTGYALDAAAMVDLYSGGPPQGHLSAILSTILKRDSPPETFEEWVEAAQMEQRTYAILRAHIGLDGRECRIAGKSKEEWRKVLMSGGRNQDRSYALTNEEMQRYRAEGHWFRCFNQGHPSHTRLTTSQEVHTGRRRSYPPQSLRVQDNCRGMRRRASLKSRSRRDCPASGRCKHCRGNVTVQRHARTIENRQTILHQLHRPSQNHENRGENIGRTFDDAVTRIFPKHGLVGLGSCLQGLEDVFTLRILPS